MEDNIDINPVLYWLTRERDLSYDESLDWVLKYFNRSAERYLYAASPEGSPELDMKTLIHVGLHWLQDKILDQYLPLLNAKESRVVNAVWPNWLESGVRVELPDGTIDRVATPLPASGTREIRKFADGREYSFTFYDSQFDDQRHRWFRHVLKETSKRKGWGERTGTRKSTDDTHQTALEPEFVDRIANEELVAALRKIVPAADLAWFWPEERFGKNDAERKEKSRARHRLQFAIGIIASAHKDPAGRQIQDELRTAADGERAGILNEHMRHAPPSVARVTKIRRGQNFSFGG
jgi:hypothetical protein